MTSADRKVTALDIPANGDLDPDIQAYFAKCEEKLGMVPNVLRAYSFNQEKLRAFMAMYNDLMLADSGLSKLEREMIAVVVSAENKCFYCLAAHSAQVRALSGDPALGDTIVYNYRAANLEARQRAMLDFAVSLTRTPQTIGDADRSTLRDAGLSDRDIWDVAAVASFFNMSNRMAAATDMQPNAEYHSMAR